MRNPQIQRRQVLAGLGAAGAMALTGRHGAWAQTATEVPFSVGTEPPEMAVPANACDCHFHIYDPRFEYLPNAALKPAPATVTDYRRLQARLGTTRGVVIQPSSYGTDNACTVDGVRQLGANARGIAVVDDTVTDDTLAELDAAGIRGLRFNLSRGSVTTPEMMAPLSARIADLGWHIQVHVVGTRLPELAPAFDGVVVPVVFDHFGRIPKDQGVDHPAYGVIADLIAQDRAWVKLSEPDRDFEGAPDPAATMRLAQALIALAPERMLWGSDWPHPAATNGEMPIPDDARRMDRLMDWAPDAAQRQLILVDNPAALYGFT